MGECFSELAHKSPELQVINHQNLGNKSTELQVINRQNYK